jgi:hypothetical protein
MPDYQQGKIYKIVCNTTGLTYYGSTTRARLASRITSHRSNFKQYKEGKSYISSFEVLKNGNYDYSLVENYPCNSKDELHSRERFWIVNNACVNKVIPKRTKNEYRKDNYILMINCERKSREKNKEIIRVRQREFESRNRDKLNARKRERRSQREQIHCECGGKHKSHNKSVHVKSKRHQQFIQTQQT